MADPTSCTFDFQCPDGYTCEDGTCRRTTCFDDPQYGGQCPSGFHCFRTGVKAINGICFPDGEPTPEMLKARDECEAQQFRKWDWGQGTCLVQAPSPPFCKNVGEKCPATKPGSVWLEPPCCLGLDCYKHAGQPDPTCDFVTCRNERDECNKNEQCCSGACVNGRCTGQPLCLSENAECGPDQRPCCLGMWCRKAPGEQKAHCISGFQCLLPGWSCENQLDCCTGACVDGRCMIPGETPPGGTPPSTKPQEQQSSTAATVVFVLGTLGILTAGGYVLAKKRGWL